jgi:hypothetical protein
VCREARRLINNHHVVVVVKNRHRVHNDGLNSRSAFGFERHIEHGAGSGSVTLSASFAVHNGAALLDDCLGKRPRKTKEAGENDIESFTR